MTRQHEWVEPNKFWHVTCCQDLVRIDEFPNLPVDMFYFIVIKKNCFKNMSSVIIFQNSIIIISILPRFSRWRGVDRFRCVLHTKLTMRISWNFTSGMRQVIIFGSSSNSVQVCTPICTYHSLLPSASQDLDFVNLLVCNAVFCMFTRNVHAGKYFSVYMNPASFYWMFILYVYMINHVRLS